MRRTFCITDKSNVYEVTFCNLTIEKVVKYYPDSELQHEVDFNFLSEDLQDMIIDKIKELHEQYLQSIFE